MFVKWQTAVGFSQVLENFEGFVAEDSVLDAGQLLLVPAAVAVDLYSVLDAEQLLLVAAVVAVDLYSVGLQSPAVVFVH